MKQKQQLETVQVLRALAAIAVVFNHVWGPTSYFMQGKPLVDRLHVGTIAALGVSVFFCISGMIMMLTYPRRLGRREAAGKFLLDRVQRVYPIYTIWLTVFLAGGALAALLGIYFQNEALATATGWHLFGNYLLLPGLNDPTYRMFLPQAWTLVYEMYFYVMFTLGLFLFGSRHMLLGICAIIGGMFLASQFAFGWSEDVRLNWNNAAYMVGDPLVLNFLMGAALGAFIVKKPGMKASSRFKPFMMLAMLGMFGVATYLVEDRMAASLLCFGVLAVAVFYPLSDRGQPARSFRRLWLMLPVPLIR